MVKKKGSRDMNPADAYRKEMVWLCSLPDEHGVIWIEQLPLFCGWVNADILSHHVLVCHQKESSFHCLVADCREPRR